jgi:hypothetical protein
VVRTIVLPEGADILRITADWEQAISNPGGSQSNDFTVSVVGPDGQTGDFDTFDNAQNSTSPVTDLEGEIILSSQGTAGTYTFTFETVRSTSGGTFTDVQIDTELIIESFTDSGNLNSGSSTWDRPDESFGPTPIGSTYYYDTFSFTPGFSGRYVVDTAAVPDAFIYLYSPSFDPLNPTTNGEAADDDRELRSDQFPGEDPKIIYEVPTAGVNYVLVTTTFDETTNLSYTNTIRHSVRLDQLPNTWPAFQSLYNLTSFTSDKDMDGILDGFEYAFGTNPEVPDDISDYQELSLSSGTLSLIFTRDASLTDIEYIVEGSTTLAPLSYTAIATLTSASGANNAPGGDATKYEVTDTGTIASFGGARFLRLRIHYTGP